MGLRDVDFQFVWLFVLARQEQQLPHSLHVGPETVKSINVLAVKFTLKFIAITDPENYMSFICALW